MARAVGETRFKVVADFLAQGYRVELPQMTAYLTMHGKKAAKAKGHKSKEMHPEVHMQPKGMLRDCYEDVFDVDLVTGQAAVVIDRFCDANMQNGAISNGTNVNVSLVGLGLYMPDTSDPTVGVWIEDSHGKIRSRAVVNEATMATLSLIFPKIDLPIGKGYYLCVASFA